MLSMQNLLCCVEEILLSGACVQRSIIAQCGIFVTYYKTRMWANAQPDGRPAEHRWRPLFNTAIKVWLTPTTRCRAVTLPRRKTR